MKSGPHAAQSGPIDQILRWPWGVAGLVALASLATELVDLFLDSPEPLSLAALGLALLHAVVFPLVVGISLSAIGRARAQAALARSEAARSERLQISQELHDSLAQELGYIYMKLDQFSRELSSEEATALQYDLERTRDIANDAYEQVRAVLVELRDTQTGDLADDLLSQARSIAARAGFQVRFTCEGQSQILPARVHRRVLYLCREALANVEKHASARQVAIEIRWSGQWVTVRLADDGCGFNPAAAAPGGHFGLAMMHEHAKAIAARLAVNSQPGAGTEVVLQIPIGAAATARSSSPSLQREPMVPEHALLARKGGGRTGNASPTRR